MKSISCVIGIAIALLVVFIPLASAQNWYWDTGNRLLNPSGITVTPPSSPCLFDIDGDGDYDLVIGQGDGTIKLYYNDGFPDSIRWRERPGYFAGLDFDYAVAPTLGDIDQDDSLELVVTLKDETNTPYDSLRAFRNRGSPSDPEWEEVYGYFIFDYVNYGPVADHKFIDWDNDGDLDMIVRGQTYYFLRNAGYPGQPLWEFDDGITAALGYVASQACGAEGIDVADFDADGDFDVVSSQEICDAGFAEIFLNFNLGTNENPIFNSDSMIWIGSPCGYFQSPTIAHLDDDNDFDFVTGGAFVQLWYSGNSGGSAIPVFNGIGDLRLGSFFVDGLHDFAFLDREPDGDLDFAGMDTYLIFILYPYPHFELYMQQAAFDNIGNATRPDFAGAGWFSRYWFLPVEETGLTSGDINGDLLTDIAHGFGPVLSCYINVPDSNFRADTSVFAPINQAGDYQHPEFVDLNLDGLLDVIVLDLFTDQLTAFRNTGTPQDPDWTPSPEWLSGLDLDATYANIAFLDRGGLPDLVLKVGDHLQAYINIGDAGNPQFVYAPEIFESIANFPVQYFDMADLDGDSDYDVVVNNDGEFTFIENESVVGVESDASTAQVGFEYLNFPNPFCSNTSISFALALEANVSVRVYDLCGRLVRDLGPRNFSAGRHSMIWDGEDSAGQSVRSGVYFYRISIDGRAAHTHRMVLLR